MSPASPIERAQVTGLPRHVVGVAGVVVNEAGRALTVRRRSPPRWEAPGGALEPGETIEDGLRREIDEETGLAVEPVRLTGVYQNMALGPVALVFLCRRVSGVERLSEETTDWRWIAAPDVAELMPPAFAARFADALGAWSALSAGRLPDGVPVRAHDGRNLV